ncbi:MAG: HK97 family phage prohead protease [Hyphomonas sp.]|jgi:HK97 family phage prohead protease
MRREPLLIEGYASVFGKPDLSGDVVRAGAFTRSLSRRPEVPLLIGHRAEEKAGRWVRAAEDGYGLFVRGLIDKAAGLRLVEAGARGLSIGFYPRVWTPRVTGGRELIEVDLVEVSIVAEPMHRMARFEVRGAGHLCAA